MIYSFFTICIDAQLLKPFIYRIMLLGKFLGVSVQTTSWVQAGEFSSKISYKWFGYTFSVLTYGYFTNFLAPNNTFLHLSNEKDTV